MPEKITRFGFGKNWERFIKKNFSEERVAIAQKHLLGFLVMDNLRGKYFLDVGCGSGLHSLAALRAGADRIVSFDIDQDSVNATLKLKEFSGNPTCWEVREGSILDGEFIKTIDAADIVYAWGVLHHTGEMWRAFENTSQLMRDDGIFYLALYTDAPYFDLPMAFWLDVKKRYNHQGWFGKKRMVFWYFWEFYLHRKWRNLPAFFKQAADYKARGMDICTDAVDWVGGWPMEYASAEEVIRFSSERLKLTLVNIKTGGANAEYLFRRTDQVSVSTKSFSTSEKISTYKPLNLQARNVSPEALLEDVKYAVQVGKCYMNWLPEGHKNLQDKVVLELGPGINFGSALLLACYGAKVTVADRFLAPWDEYYHPQFYSLLIDWIKENIRELDVTPLERIFSNEGYCSEAIRCYSCAIEALSGISDSSVDIIYSNAVLEHLYAPGAAFRSLARISKPGALGLHQVDFRYHKMMDRPLEFLLLSDAEFAKEFEECHGECGNRYRPYEYHNLFEAAGFQVLEFKSSLYAEANYFEEFIPRLRAASGSKYQYTDADKLREISGFYSLVRKANG
jgi:SAM-dependent methyltransferase